MAQPGLRQGAADAPGVGRLRRPRATAVEDAQGKVRAEYTTGCRHRPFVASERVAALPVGVKLSLRLFRESLVAALH